MLFIYIITRNLLLLTLYVMCNFFHKFCKNNFPPCCLHLKLSLWHFGWLKKVFYTVRFGNLYFYGLSLLPLCLECYFGLLMIINSVANLSADMLGFPVTLNSWFGDVSSRATLRFWNGHLKLTLKHLVKGSSAIERKIYMLLDLVHTIKEQDLVKIHLGKVQV